MTWPRRCCLALLLLTATFGQLPAQGAWDAVLNIDPYPSPYYSDWDNDPNIATLTVINSTTSAQQVRIHFNVTNHANRIVLSGSSDAQDIGAGATVIFDNPYDVAGTTHRDTEEEDIASRTGRLREGDYTACAVVADLTGFSLAESCAPFTIVYPDPPLLLGPDHGEVLTQQDPLFQWTPVQVPIDFQLSYVMRVVEVLQGQTPAEALRSNIPHFQTLDAQQPSLRYPIDARPFEVGKQYAWTVQVLDQNGYAAATNDGRSEIWTFRYDDVSTTLPGSSTVHLTIVKVNENEGGGTDGMSLDDVVETYSSPSPTSGLGQICSAWGDPERVESIVFPVLSPLAFPNRTELPAAALVRDTLANDRLAWAVTGIFEKFTIMLTGGCTNDVTVPRWVGIRTTGDAQEVSTWIYTDTVIPDSDLPKLKFGVAIFSLFEEVAGAAADSIEIVRAFLEDHAIQLKPGINLYGVLDMRQYPDAWEVLSKFYEDDEHEVELQGFLGLNQNVAVRIGTKGAAMAMDQERLVLRAALPQKKRDGLFKTTQWGFEIAFGDSLAGGRTWGGNRIGDLAFNLKPQLTFTGVTRAREPAWLFPEDVTWKGSLEFNFSYSPTAQANERFPVTRTLRLKTSYEFPLGNSPVALGHPEIFLDVNNSVIAALASGHPGRIDVDVNGRASVIMLGEEIATGHLTIGRKGSTPQSNLERAEQLMRGDSALITTFEDAVKQAESEVQSAIAFGDTAMQRVARERLAHRKASLEQYRKDVRLSTLKVERLRKPDKRRPATPGAGPQDPSKDRAADDHAGKVFAEFTVALGNMGLANLFDWLGAALGWSK
jgi:hypothetical protein